MERRPDFLLAGMQRSGTIWVSATLNEHPDIDILKQHNYVGAVYNAKGGEQTHSVAL
jgi:hypothetical protein